MVDVTTEMFTRQMEQLGSDHVLDVRSDTVTKPTQEMRDAMYNAEVGDEYYDEDPTVLRLEEMAADRLGKEAALLVASGTMGNLVSVMTHTRRGDAIIVEADAHVYRCEGGHIAMISGVLPKRMPGRNGILFPEDVDKAQFAKALGFPTITLLCLENTHNAAGGSCTTVQQMEALRAACDKYGMKIHVDGARIFNAAVALGVPASALSKDADSLTFCLSKGLSCPWGALIGADRAFIAEARKNRQAVGGGMRQAGMMAAAGIVALEKMVDRLAEDHANARILAEGLVKLGYGVNLEATQTNIVFVHSFPDGLTPQTFVANLRKGNVWVNVSGGTRVRFLTHYPIVAEDINVIVRLSQAML